MFKNKILIILFVVILSISLVGCSNSSTSNDSKENISTKELTKIESFTLDNIQNKAIFIVHKDEKVPYVESKLLEFKEKFDIDIVKMEYNETIPTFVKEQEKLFENLDQIRSIDEKLQDPKIKGEDFDFEGFANTIYDNVNQALDLLSNKEEPTEQMKYILENANISEEELNTYLNGRLQLESIIIEGPINENDLPLLLLFNDREKARIQAFPQPEEQLDWFLISKGLIQLSQTETLKEISNLSAQNKDFVVSFGSSTCPYCNNTSPLVEEIALQQGVDYYYVDISTTVNDKYFDEYYSKEYVTEPIESTPTFIFFKNGKEADRIVGQKTRTELTDFIKKNISLK